ncbi:MAG: Ig-like domain-containing protein [Proteobacteria bacterium]|nr:Ig-like domain-containing protein [Pseudomonadota bacterium]
MIESSKTTDQNAVAASDGDAGTDDGVKPPSFDVVRVNPKGDAVIAGRADPGAEVTVRDAGTVVGKTTADKRGEWVIVPEKPLASGARQLSLQETTTTGQIKDSKDVVVLLVPEQPRADGASGALAVLTPREGQGSRVLQAPAAPSTKADSEKDLSLDLSLGVIDYDEKGRVVLSGKAPPGSEVRAIVDDKTVGSARADKAGDWQISPDKPVVSGQHAIRIEQVSKSGAILAKLSVPFSRATVRPGTLAPGTIVVEPGNSLWRIARMTYGEGTKYTLIFAANSEQIGNPNVIFPGQIFVLPPNTASN